LTGSTGNLINYQHVVTTTLHHSDAKALLPCKGAVRKDAG